MMTPEAARANEPIAIVGMGCRFPGADGLDAFWTLLASGTDAIAPMSASRGLDAYYDPTPGTPGRFVTREGGFLEGLDRFDPSFFGISPREAVLLDPQQRLLLELAWEAFEDAGIVPERVAGSAGGVFVGMWTNEYEDHLYASTSNIDLYMTTGSGRYAASGRLSYVFDLRGPSLTLDTACSSSLVAIHLACRSIRSGESDFALAAGVNVILQPHISIGYSRSLMLSPTARCRFGDANADGYVRSEGAGVVVLKRLSAALAGGDRIQALILGSAVNNDGRSSGLLVSPSATGQEAMLREAYREAGISPGEVQYVEAHGTGTRVGDPIELAALSTVLSSGRPASRPCVVGSVKTNIGHVEGAAGIAGIVKTVLAMRRGVIPPSLHLESPNPAIPWESIPLTIGREPQPWPAAAGARVAGVSSFGITGTNAHVVLQGFPEPTAVAPETGSDASDRVRLLPISAQSQGALLETARLWADFLRDQANDGGFDDICYTAAVRRTHHEHRLTVAAYSKTDAAQQLDAFAAGESRPGLAHGRVDASVPHRIVFVFPGQGSQWLGMARTLLIREPAFRVSLERCDAVIRELTGWSVLDELSAGPARSRLGEIDIVQPVLFSIQVALAALWRACGVKPDAVVGHSMGEIAAAHVSGALSLEDSARIICRRSTLLRRTSGRGAMAVVELSLDDAHEAIAPFRETLSVAVSNSSRSTVLSGDPATLDALLAALERRGTFCRKVKVDVASHSPQMEPLRDELLLAVDGITPQSGAVTFCSTVLGRPVDGVTLTAAYWVRNLREPVLFSSAIEYLLAQGHDTYVEMSAHPLLVAAVQQIASEAGTACTALPSCRRDEDECAVMLASLGALHCQGVAVDWSRLVEQGQVVSLPAYRWQRERFWYDPPTALDPRRRGAAGDLLGEPVRPASQSGACYWEFDLGLATLPFLADHRVRGSVVVPAAFFIQLAAEAARRALGSPVRSLRQISIGAGLVASEGGVRTIQVAVASDRRGAATVRVLSRDGSDDARWVEHASALAHADDDSAGHAAGVREALDPGATEPFNAAAHYEMMRRRGLDYGPAFRGVDGGWRHAGHLQARLAVPDSGNGAAATIQFETVLLDACFQSVVAAIPAGDPEIGAGDTYVPVALGSLQVFRTPQPGSPCSCRVTFGSSDQGGSTVTGDFRLLEPDGTVACHGVGLRLFRVERQRDVQVREALNHLAWQPAALPAAAASEAGEWIVAGDQPGVLHDLAARLISRGARATVAGAADAARLASVGVSFRGLVYIANDRPANMIDLDTPWNALEVVQGMIRSEVASPPRLWLVTRGAHAIVAGDPVSGLAGSTLWGLRSVIASEYPGLVSSAIDLSHDPGGEELEAFVDDLLADGADHEIALRGGARFVRRLRRGFSEPPPGAVLVERAAGRPYRAITQTPGILDGLCMQTFRRRVPQAREVEIEVAAAGLNFMNVMSALGVYPGAPQGVGPLGIECAGRIVRIGSLVERLKPGDEVMAFAHNSLATHAIADERLVARIAKGMDFDRAATIPIAFLTACYALVHLGRLAKGDKLLIHSATGGVGMAALQIARRLGAEVLATAGTEEKRELLRSMGIAHVFDSRSLSFVDGVREATGADGVDVVLNSLAGDAIPAGLSLLRDGGRFLEIGKRDIYENRAIGLFPFHRNLSYFAIDLDRMARERPDVLEGIFDCISADVAASLVQPLPARVFPVSEIADAFRLMAQGGHTGKVVVEIERENAPVQASPSGFTGISPDRTYLITGGTGGLGVEVTRWLARQGARALVLLARRGETPTLTAALQPLRESGVTISVVAGDVSDAADVARAMQAIDGGMPPLAGVIHAAGVLDDATIERVERHQFARVTAPKVSGAWNLHLATAERPLDFFVLFSSVTSFIGSAGQASYAAANAFLDSLAAYRRAQHLPAQTINWGPWAAVGLAAERTDRGARLAERGLDSLSPEVAIAALAEVLQRNPLQAAIMSFDVHRWCEALPAAAKWPLFADRLAESPIDGPAPSDSTVSLRQVLEAVPPGRRRQTLLEDYVRQTVAQVLKLAPARVDVNKPLRSMGLDSLMGLELRNRLEAGTGAALTATLIFNYPTVAAMAPQLAERMGLSLGEPAVEAVTEDATLAALLDELEGIPEEQARALMAESLEAEREV